MAESANLDLGTTLHNYSLKRHGRLFMQRTIAEDLKFRITSIAILLRNCVPGAQNIAIYSFRSEPNPFAASNLSPEFTVIAGESQVYIRSLAFTLLKPPSHDWTG
jgi:hypothetical protein